MVTDDPSHLPSLQRGFHVGSSRDLHGRLILGQTSIGPLLLPLGDEVAWAVQDKIRHVFSVNFTSDAQQYGRPPTYHVMIVSLSV